MKNEKKNIMTYEGIKALEEELEDLKVNKRKEVAQKIKEAREQGDLSENAEYDAAKEEQGHIESRIKELEALIKNVEVVEEDEIDYEAVHLGCIVKLRSEDDGEVMMLQMVGSTEVSSLSDKISNESPIGQALMGRRAGETVTVNAPVGELKFTILEIERTE